MLFKKSTAKIIDVIKSDEKDETIDDKRTKVALDKAKEQLEKNAN